MTEQRTNEEIAKRIVELYYRDEGDSDNDGVIINAKGMLEVRIKEVLDSKDAALTAENEACAKIAENWLGDPHIMAIASTIRQRMKGKV